MQSTSPATLGRYQIVREIARSNDIVWEAVDATMARHVAVKELALPPELTGDARHDRIERFFREARAAGAMNHPNIVTIYEVGEDDGRFFIAMEYLEGKTLRDRLCEDRGLPATEAIQVAAALADALEYAHGHNVVHRDIKPENVHLLPGAAGIGDRVKLTDFGIARITHEEQLTIAGQVFGTPSYMAPEQILGMTVDARTDLFALGVVLYEMLTGSKPFTKPGDSVITITYRIMHDPAPTPIGYPTAIVAFLARAMAKAPEERFQSAAEFRDTLLAAARMYDPMLLNGALSNGTSRPVSATSLYGSRTEVATGTSPGPATVAAGVPGERYAPDPLAAGVVLPAAAFPGRPSAGPPAPTAAYAGRYVPSGDAVDRRRRIIMTLSVAIGAMVIILGGGWLISDAYQSFRVRQIQSESGAAYIAASRLYQSGNYEAAARAFDAVRTASNAGLDAVTRATAGEIYSYRQLGHSAQDQGDYAGAVRWYQQALSLDPNDEQTRTELAAAEQRAGLPPTETVASPAATIGSTPGSPGTPVQPASSPPPAGDNPLAPLLSSPMDGAATSIAAPLAPEASATPPVQTSNDFVSANQRAADAAQALYNQGEQAYERGDRATALSLWRQAVAAGPGSPGAIQAGQQITQITNQQSVY
jgi:serine/threonine-protein kinase